ncbi:hypothetical protein M405DRAFT_846196 [Rhizopogon salebrosus TDB-379]|nr:hypothetical protein M405DRAFT_846196 [Rhizopogon salebrosus TDB-379]
MHMHRLHMKITNMKRHRQCPAQLAVGNGLPSFYHLRPKAKFGVMSSFALDDSGSVSDLTCYITKLGSPAGHGSFSQVYQSTMVTSEGNIEVAVKVLLIDPERSMAKIEKAPEATASDML